MDGLLIVDKPAGPTSHDVVARVRRALHERAVGHTGTLDPGASGVLPLVVGRATRLARFLSDADKSYEAVVKLGTRTDTYDADGRVVGPVHSGPPPSSAAIESALGELRGERLQQPPAYSAKKIGGRRSYQIARAASRASQSAAVADPSDPALPDLPDPPTLPAPVSVTAHAIDVLAFEGDVLTIRVSCSTGYYVRSLAHDLGNLVGIGAHLKGLRRLSACGFTLDDAIALDEVERAPHAAVSRLIPLERMLPGLPAVVLTADGVRRVSHGMDISPADSATPTGRWAPSSASLRLVDPEGRLVAIARPGSTPGTLHPSIVLM